METNQIISSLYRDKRVDKCVSNFSEPCNADDFKHEIFLRLMAKDKQLIHSLHKQGTLYFYLVTIAVNLHKENCRGRKIEPVADIPEPHEDDTAGYLLAQYEAMELTTENGFPYHKKLIDLIVKYGSQRRVAIETGIPRAVISESVQEVRNYLTSKL